MLLSYFRQIFLLLILVPAGAAIVQATDIPLSFGDPKAGIAEGWREQHFRATDPTQYRLLEDGGEVVLQADSCKQASGLVYEIDVDLASYPILVWRWKVDDIIPAGNALTKEGDDYPARAWYADIRLVAADKDADPSLYCPWYRLLAKPANAQATVVPEPSRLPS